MLIMSYKDASYKLQRQSHNTHHSAAEQYYAQSPSQHAQVQIGVVSSHSLISSQWRHSSTPYSYILTTEGTRFLAERCHLLLVTLPAKALQIATGSLALAIAIPMQPPLPAER